MEGVILHIHQSFHASLHNCGVTENSGVFVTRAHGLVSVPPKGCASGSDLTKPSRLFLHEHQTRMQTLDERRILMLEEMMAGLPSEPVPLEVDTHLADQPEEVQHPILTLVRATRDQDSELCRLALGKSCGEAPETGALQRTTTAGGMSNSHN